MQPDVTDEEYSKLCPFSEIVGNANVLIMPGQHSATISYKIMKTWWSKHRTTNWSCSTNRDSSFKSSTSEILNLASVAILGWSYNYKKRN